MAFTKEEKRRIWRRYFPYADSWLDVFGERMSIDNFEVIYLLEEDKGGTTELANGFPLSKISAKNIKGREKGFYNDRKFSFIHSWIPGKGILMVDDRKVSQ